MKEKVFNLPTSQQIEDELNEIQEKRTDALIFGYDISKYDQRERELNEELNALRGK